MTKILASVPCTNCGKDHDAVIDLDSVPRVVSEKEEKPEPQKNEVKLPSFLPGYACVNGACDMGGWHENSNYSQAVRKKCTNCDQLLPASAKKCAWCKGDDFDEVDDDDLQSLGIPLPAGGHKH